MGLVISPKSSIFTRTFVSPNSRRHLSTKLPRHKWKSPEITRPGSITKLETTTFLEEKDSENLTEDWAKSLLYQKVALGEEISLALTEQDMMVISRKPPRDPEIIAKVMEKGLGVLKILLMELLGTKEDMQRFEERFKGKSPVHVRALMERCINLMKVRTETLEILVEIHKRELVIKNLETSKNRVKDKVLKVYRLNKVVREKINKWVLSDSIPFNKFIFKGQDYLTRICEETIALQERLNISTMAKPVKK